MEAGGYSEATRKIISGRMIRKIRHTIFLYFSSITLFLMGGCSGGDQRVDLDTADSGTIHISVDESFRPLIDSEIQVYEALHPNTKIIAEYKPEGECFKDLQKDSTRMIIVTRKLTQEEEKFYKDKYYFYPTISKIAYDAIAIIVSKEAPDTMFYKPDLKSILDGSIGGNKKAVFDGVSGSSVLTYIRDSLLRGKQLDSSRAFGVNGSTEVIKRVEDDKNLIGFIGVSWIGNPEDTTQMSFLTRVNIASLQCTCPEKAFVKPYQANIVAHRYPFTRGVYFILKENYAGLGSAFGNFLESERGQLIIRRSYLGPAKLNFTIRQVTY